MTSIAGITVKVTARIREKPLLTNRFTAELSIIAKRAEKTKGIKISCATNKNAIKAHSPNKYKGALGIVVSF